MKMPLQPDILGALRRGELVLPPASIVSVEAAGGDPPRRLSGTGRRGLGSGRGEPFARVDIRYRKRTGRFIALVLGVATPKAVRDGMTRIRIEADRGRRAPLLLALFLSPERLAELEAASVSGVDLCGNGIVIMRDGTVVYRTGNPNLYPAARGIAAAYSGRSGLVAQAFLVRPSFDSVQQVMDEVVARGGEISLGTVSKALAALEEDLMIRRDGRRSELLQAEALLDKLATSYDRAKSAPRRTYRWTGDESALRMALGRIGDSIALTGASSVDQYATFAREKTIRCYCFDLRSVERMLAADTVGVLEESSRFPDLELIETDEVGAYFDLRERDGLRVASPVRCWVELQAGDSRERVAAAAVRRLILDELVAQGWRGT